MRDRNNETETDRPGRQGRGRKRRHGQGAGHDHEFRQMSGQHRSRARRGAVIAAILGALKDGPSHGYGIMDRLENQSEGRWRPSPGSVYPTLGRLANKGLIEAVEGTDPKEFQLTEDGSAWLEDHSGAAGPGEGMPWSAGQGQGLRSAVSQLAGAAKQVGRFGSDSQRTQAQELVEETTRLIYALLAQAPDNEVENESAKDATD